MWCESFRDRTSVELARTAKLLRRFEDKIDELPLDISLQGIDVLKFVPGEELVARICTDENIYETVRFEEEGLLLVFELLKGKCNDNIRSFYDDFAKKIAKYIYRNLKQWLFADEEFGLIMTLNGDVAIFKGFESYIRIPVSDVYIAFGHTHPRGYACMSRKDIASALDILTRRAFAFCTVGIDGILCLYRRLLVDLEEYERLLLSLSNYDVFTIKELHELVGYSIGVIKL